MAGNLRTAQPQYTLESIALFKGVSLATLEKIKQRCSHHRYATRETIIDYLDDANDVCFLLSGPMLRPLDLDSILRA